MTRETHWPIKTERLTARENIPERQMVQAYKPQEVLDYYTAKMSHEMAREVEGKGFTTHPDIIRDHGEWATMRDPASFEIPCRLRFPPAAPAPRDPVTFLNGPLAGTDYQVPDSININTGPEFNMDPPIIYEPHGFNTATGHWTYRTNN